MEEKVLDQTAVKTSQFSATTFFYDVETKTANGVVSSVNASQVRRLKDGVASDYVGTISLTEGHYCATLQESVTKDEYKEIVSDFFDIVISLKG